MTPKRKAQLLAKVYFQRKPMTDYYQAQIAEYLADNYLHGDTELANAFARRILDAEQRADYPDMLATIEAARTCRGESNNLRPEIVILKPDRGHLCSVCNKEILPAQNVWPNGKDHTACQDLVS